MLQTAVAKVYNRFYSTKILIKNCSLQFELLTTYHSKTACKMSYTPKNCPQGDKKLPPRRQKIAPRETKNCLQGHKKLSP